jgi:hypothetical protein
VAENDRNGFGVGARGTRASHIAIADGFNFLLRRVMTSDDIAILWCKNCHLYLQITRLLVMMLQPQALDSRPSFANPDFIHALWLH